MINLKQFSLLLAATLIICNVAAQTVKVNPNVTYQVMDGFGDASMYSIMEKSYTQYNYTEEQLNKVLNRLFTRNEPDYLGWNTSMIVSRLLEVVDNNQNYIENPPIDDYMWYYKGAYDRGAKLFLRQEVLRFFREIIGGTAYLKEGYEDENAQLIIYLLKKFEEEFDIQIAYLNPLNESDADWWGEMNDGSVSTDKEQAALMIKETYNALQDSNLSRIKIIAEDNFYINTTTRLNHLLNGETNPMIDIISFHQYQDDNFNRSDNLQNWDQIVHEKHGKKLWQSEWGDWHNLGIDKKSQHTQFMNYATIIYRALNHAKVNNWLAWEVKYFFEVDEEDWHPRKSYYAMAHFSSFIEPGMQMVQTNNMGDKGGTLAFIADNDTANKLSVITLNDADVDKELVFDFNNFSNPVIDDIRLTNELMFTKVTDSLDKRKRLYISIPPESLMSLRITFDDVIDTNTAVSQSEYSLQYVDSEETSGEDGAATNAFDGDSSTIWHTQWSGSKPNHPHEIQINLGGEYLLSGFSYLPRQEGSNGIIAEYEFYVSLDSNNWGSPVDNGMFSPDKKLKKVNFFPKYGKFIRLVSRSEINNNAYASAAEITAYAIPIPTEIVNADFTSSHTEIIQGQSIKFKDFTENFPKYREWYFEGGSITTAQDELVKVTYDIPGKYQVKLIVSNDMGADSIVLDDYITVSVDSVSPTIPANLSALTTTTTSIIKWDASSDEVVVEGYNIYKNDELITTTTELKYIFTELDDNSNYIIGVSAVDKVGNESEISTIEAGTLEYIENEWVKVPIENHSFELPNDNEKYLLLTDIPGWTDDDEEYNGMGRESASGANGSKVAYMSSHLGGTMYQPVADLIADKETSYKLTFLLRVSSYSNKSAVGKFHSIFGSYPLTGEPSKRSKIQSLTVDLPGSQKSFKKHEVEFHINANSSKAGNLLTIEFDLTDVDDNSWIQFDDIQLSKYIGVPESINSIDNNDIKLFFTNQYISVTLDKLSHTEITCYDVSGKILFDEQFKGNTYIKNHSLNKGIYIIKIENNNTSITRKIAIY